MPARTVAICTGRARSRSRRRADRRTPASTRRAGRRRRRGRPRRPSSPASTTRRRARRDLATQRGREREDRPRVVARSTIGDRAGDVFLDVLAVEVHDFVGAPRGQLADVGCLDRERDDTLPASPAAAPSSSRVVRARGPARRRPRRPDRPVRGAATGARARPVPNRRARRARTRNRAAVATCSASGASGQRWRARSTAMTFTGPTQVGDPSCAPRTGAEVGRGRRGGSARPAPRRGRAGRPSSGR